MVSVHSRSIVCLPRLSLATRFFTEKNLGQRKHRSMSSVSRGTRRISSATRQVSRETRLIPGETRRASKETRRISRDTRGIPKGTRRFWRETRSNVFLSGSVAQKIEKCRGKNAALKHATILYWWIALFCWLEVRLFFNYKTPGLLSQFAFTSSSAENFRDGDE